MIDRMERVAGLIKREISIILQDEVNDPDIGPLTITKIDITRDMRMAKVYYVFFDEDPVKRKNGSSALKRASKFVRGEIAKRLSMKYTPEISFREDVSKRKEDSIDDIFKKIEEERT
ncbi:MAG: 30S ribosome-binding factor RbfA [Candidatus Aadella gelida]|nr:30S ribosome-binding factor RbfA [Candidatus Aadella gelida]